MGIFMISPDRWCLFFIPSGDVKVFATWQGSYLGGNSWRSNSGIESIEETSDSFLFKGFSGSVYNCLKNSYGITVYGASILPVEPMSEEEALKYIKEKLEKL